MSGRYKYPRAPIYQTHSYNVSKYIPNNNFNRFSPQLSEHEDAEEEEEDFEVPEDADMIAAVFGTISENETLETDQYFDESLANHGELSPQAVVSRQLSYISLPDYLLLPDTPNSSCSHNRRPLSASPALSIESVAMELESEDLIDYEGIPTEEVDDETCSIQEDDFVNVRVKVEKKAYSTKAVKVTVSVQPPSDISTMGESEMSDMSDEDQVSEESYLLERQSETSESVKDDIDEELESSDQTSESNSEEIESDEESSESSYSSEIEESESEPIKNKNKPRVNKTEQNKKEEKEEKDTTEQMLDLLSVAIEDSEKSKTKVIQKAIEDNKRLAEQALAAELEKATANTVVKTSSSPMIKVKGLGESVVSGVQRAVSGVSHRIDHLISNGKEQVLDECQAGEKVLANVEKQVLGENLELNKAMNGIEKNICQEADNLNKILTSAEALTSKVVSSNLLPSSNTILEKKLVEKVEQIIPPNSIVVANVIVHEIPSNIETPKPVKKSIEAKENQLPAIDKQDITPSLPENGLPETQKLIVERDLSQQMETESKPQNNEKYEEKDDYLSVYAADSMESSDEDEDNILRKEKTKEETEEDRKAVELAKNKLIEEWKSTRQQSVDDLDERFSHVLEDMMSELQMEPLVPVLPKELQEAVKVPEEVSDETATSKKGSSGSSEKVENDNDKSSTYSADNCSMQFEGRESTPSTQSATNSSRSQQTTTESSVPTLSDFSDETYLTSQKSSSRSSSSRCSRCSTRSGESSAHSTTSSSRCTVLSNSCNSSIASSTPKQSAHIRKNNTLQNSATIKSRTTSSKPSPTISLKSESKSNSSTKQASLNSASSKGKRKPLSRTASKNSIKIPSPSFTPTKDALDKLSTNLIESNSIDVDVINNALNSEIKALSPNNGESVPSSTPSSKSLNRTLSQQRLKPPDINSLKESQAKNEVNQASEPLKSPTISQQSSIQTEQSIDIEMANDFEAGVRNDLPNFSENYLNPELGENVADSDSNRDEDSPSQKRKWKNSTEIASTLSHYLHLVKTETVENCVTEIIPLLTQLLVKSRKTKSQYALATSIATLSAIRVLCERLHHVKVLSGERALRNMDLSWLLRILCKLSADPESKLRPETGFTLARLVTGAGPELITRPIYFLLVMENEGFGHNKGAQGSKTKAAALDTLTYALLAFPKEEFDDLEEITRWVCLVVMHPHRRVRQAALECIAVLGSHMGTNPDATVTRLRGLIAREAEDKYNRSDSDGNHQKGAVRTFDGKGVFDVSAITAISARIRKRILPLPSPHGLVEYGVKVPTGQELVLILTKMQEEEEEDYEGSTSDESVHSSSSKDDKLFDKSDSESIRMSDLEISAKNDRIFGKEPKKAKDNHEPDSVDLITPDVAYVLAGKGRVNKQEYVNDNEQANEPTPEEEQEEQKRKALKKKRRKKREVVRTYSEYEDDSPADD